jgi:hypothetical protein
MRLAGATAWAGWADFYRKNSKGFDFQIKIDFRIWQDFENFYKEI